MDEFLQRRQCRTEASLRLIAAYWAWVHSTNTTGCLTHRASAAGDGPPATQHLLYLSFPFQPQTVEPGAPDRCWRWLGSAALRCRAPSAATPTAPAPTTGGPVAAPSGRAAPRATVLVSPGASLPAAAIATRHARPPELHHGSVSACLTNRASAAGDRPPATQHLHYLTCTHQPLNRQSR